MPQRSLTQLAVERLNPPKQGRVEYWDTRLPGFGLRISASGQKTWVAMYRVKGARQQIRETLGNLHEIPNVGDARARALVSLEQARAGIDPRATGEAAGTVAAVARQQDDCVATQTVTMLAERFARQHADRHCRPGTAAEYRRLFGKEIEPYWGPRPLSSITKSDVNALLDRKAESRPLQANELRKHLRTFFRWALDEELVTADPTAGTRLRTKPQARDRVLSDSEIKLVWQAADELGWPFGRITQLLIITAQRRDEVGGMRRSELDLEGRRWALPKERTKNGIAHDVHLSDLAVGILSALPNLGDIVFTTTGATAPSGYSHAKARLDRFIAGHNGGQRIPHWTLHDIRRSTTSGLARLGVAPHVADRILNHASGTIRGVAAVYNRYQYLPERQAALELWSDHIRRLVDKEKQPPATLATAAA
jgi:integrase